MKIVVFVLLCIICFYYLSTKKHKQVSYFKNVQMDHRINVWMYSPQELLHYREPSRYPIDSKTYIPDFLTLCNLSVSNSLDHQKYNLIVITDDTLSSYLPEFPIDVTKRSRYSVKQIGDLMGALLLYKYGGLWLSPGTVFLQRDYHGLYKELVENDIVTFGSINPSHTYGEKHPDIRIIYSKPKLPVIKNYMNRLTGIMVGRLDALHKHVGFEFNPLGESIQLYSLKRRHYSSMKVGTMNVHGRKLQVDDYLGKTPIEFDSKLLCISFPYDLLDIETNYEWLKYMNASDLYQSNINLITYLNIF